MTANTPEKYSAEEWVHLSARFKESMLKTAEIAELGRSVGVSWPFKGSDETPEKYINYSFEDLQRVPGLIGKKKRVNDLMDILREILAFDDPFSNMVDSVEQKNSQDQVYHDILKRLQISENFPASLIYFSSETKELLRSKGIKTLIEVINFGKRIPASQQNGSDLHAFINSIALDNEATLSQHLPFRVGQTGLHLPEAIGLFVKGLDAEIQSALLQQAELSPVGVESGTTETTPGELSESSLQLISMHFNELCTWFEEQTVELKELSVSRESIERFFLPINNPETERVAMALALIHFDPSTQKKGGLFGKLSKLFGR